jgi:hypothetical protein
MSKPCPTPLTHEALSDYFAGVLESDAAERLEEHAFSCDACGQAFERAGALATTLKKLVPPVITHRKLRELESAGAVIRLTHVEPSKPVEVVFASGLSLLVHALRGDTASSERIDIELCDTERQPYLRFERVPVDRESGEILVACQRHYEHMPHVLKYFRVYDVKAGARRELGEYHVDHVWR